MVGKKSVTEKERTGGACEKSGHSHALPELGRKKCECSWSQPGCWEEEMISLLCLIGIKGLRSGSRNSVRSEESGLGTQEWQSCFYTRLDFQYTFCYTYAEQRMRSLASLLAYRSGSQLVCPIVLELFNGFSPVSSPLKMLYGRTDQSNKGERWHLMKA